MSGILLPGQPGRPSPEPSDSNSSAAGSGSGLVLPSSARRRPESAPAEPPPAAPASETPASETPADESIATEALDAAPAPARQAPPRGGRQLSPEDFLIPPTGAQVQCPNCGTPFVVPVFSIIDLGANPELKQMLLAGQVNMASCPRCGAGGSLSTPLMVHVPDRQWLGVLIPPEARVNEVQRQKLIGDMTQMLMRKLPQEQRKGYMLQPRQYMDWERFSEQLWEFEGVTPEMLRRQRAQSELLQSLLSLADDRDALGIAINRSNDLLDQDFFRLLDRMYLMLMSQLGPAGLQGAAPEMAPFVLLRQALLEMTPAGQEIDARERVVRDMLDLFSAGANPETQLPALIDALGEPGGREIVASVVLSVAPLLDYNYLLEISKRADAATDDEERKRIEDLRTLVLKAQEQMEQSARGAAQAATQLLQELLQEDDLEAAVRANMADIDDSFINVLTSSIQQAERNKSGGAARRLRTVYETITRVVQEGLPDELRLANLLLSLAERRADLRKALEENRESLTPAFIDTLQQLESDLRNEGREPLADRVKSIRSQAKLMM